MIGFSKKEDYSLIILTKLAFNYDVRLVSLSEIAKEYKISILFLRNLAGELRKASFIKAKEGKNGGYLLTKNPKNIKIGEVLNAISKKSAPLDCLSDHKKCPKKRICETTNAWKKISKDFMDKMNNVSLNDFIKIK